MSFEFRSTGLAPDSGKCTPHSADPVENLLIETRGLALTDEERDFVRFAEQYERPAAGELCQDLWVLFETANKTGGYFVEFGAADGSTNSNTLLLERDYRWRGALAEPCPVFERKVALGREAFVSHRGIAPVPGFATLTVAPDPFKSAFESFSMPDLHSESRSHGWQCQVETETLEDFLRRANAPTAIDYLSIDTEGSELAILQTLVWPSWDISLLSVEHNYSAQRQGIYSLLRSKGYERRFPRLSMWDDWYVKA